MSNTVPPRYRHPTPSTECRTERNNILYNQMVDDLLLLASFVTSATEAAWRGDGWLLGEYIRQLREGTIQIIQRHKQLDLVQSEKDWRTRCAAEQTEKSMAA